MERPSKCFRPQRTSPVQHGNRARATKSSPPPLLALWVAVHFDPLELAGVRETGPRASSSSSWRCPSRPGLLLRGGLVDVGQLHPGGELGGRDLPFVDSAEVHYAQGRLHARGHQLRSRRHRGGSLKRRRAFLPNLQLTTGRGCTSCRIIVMLLLVMTVVLQEPICATRPAVQPRREIRGRREPRVSPSDAPPPGLPVPGVRVRLAPLRHSLHLTRALGPSRMTDWSVFHAP